MNHDRPAFPRHPESEIHSGLNKLEYIAACAMQAIIQCSAEPDPVYAALASKGFSDSEFGQPSYYAKITAKAALIYAKSLLEEIEKDESNDSRS